MRNLDVLILKLLRKIYSKCFKVELINSLEFETDANIVSTIIYDALIDDKPCMIARFGANELSCLANYKGVINNEKKYIGYIKGNSLPWWWNVKGITMLKTGAGFFPTDLKSIEKFCILMLEDVTEVDVLASWLPEEVFFKNELQNVNKIKFTLLDPFWSVIPWTKALKNKKVLVVHPFTKTIEDQYKKRKLLFQNDLLPDFELVTIKSVQSIAGTITGFNNWFEALDYMKSEIDKVDYDICLIGAGAYGFPLAAHVKRMGKKSVHLGGSLQLLFGIKGKRWNKSYCTEFDYSELINDHWVSPSSEEKPANANLVENGCYW